MARAVIPTPEVQNPMRAKTYENRFCNQIAKVDLIEGEFVSTNKKLCWTNIDVCFEDGMIFGTVSRVGWERDFEIELDGFKVVSVTGVRHLPLAIKSLLCELGVEF